MSTVALSGEKSARRLFPIIIIYFLWHMNFHAFWGHTSPTPHPGRPSILYCTRSQEYFGTEQAFFFTRPVTHGCHVMGVVGERPSVAPFLPIFLVFPLLLLGFRFWQLNAAAEMEKGEGVATQLSNVSALATCAPKTPFRARPLIAFRKTFFSKLFAKMPHRHWE